MEQDDSKIDKLEEPCFPEAASVDDSFTQLLALYRRRVYEEYQAEFVASASAESTDDTIVFW